MKVVFFQRKTPIAFFSLEEVFDRVRSAQPKETICVVKKLTFRSSGFFKRLYGCIEASSAQGDVNHITGDINFIALFLKKRKTILTIHDLAMLRSNNIFLRMFYLWFWVKLPVNQVAIITTVSEETKKDLLKYCNCSQAKIKVIYNPISSLFIKDERDFNKVMPRILHVGVTENKNLPRLISSLKGVSCKLLILGKLSQVNIFLLHEEGIAFEEFSNLSTQAVVELYRSCDILSFVSTMEGFGLPIIEANALGRVVVTSNISSMPEVAGNAAHFVNPFDVLSIRDGIIRVIEDDEYRNRLLLNGYENAKRFDLQSIANQYNGLYQQIRRRLT